MLQRKTLKRQDEHSICASAWRCSAARLGSSAAWSKEPWPYDADCIGAVQGIGSAALQRFRHLLLLMGLSGAAAPLAGRARNCTQAAAATSLERPLRLRPGARSVLVLHNTLEVLCTIRIGGSSKTSRDCLTGCQDGIDYLAVTHLCVVCAFYHHVSMSLILHHCAAHLAMSLQ